MAKGLGSRSCETVAASVVGRTLCHTRPCASLRASTMGSELIKKQRGQNSGVPEMVGSIAKENPAQAVVSSGGCLSGVPKSLGDRVGGVSEAPEGILSLAPTVSARCDGGHKNALFTLRRGA
jgi:hypothetical protein